jgi:biopolymer transport protein TolQ
MDEIPDRAVDTVDLGGAGSHDLSMIGLFLQADIIVKIVMLTLIVSSVWCWAIIF